MLSPERFRGAVVRSRFQNSAPWGSMTVAADACDLRSGLGRRAHIDRRELARARFERVRLGLVTRTVITFFDTHNRRLGLSFIPWRADKVRAAMERHGWPLDVERLGVSGRRRQHDGLDRDY